MLSNVFDLGHTRHEVRPPRQRTPTPAMDPTRHTRWSEQPRNVSLIMYAPRTPLFVNVLQQHVHLVHLLAIFTSRLPPRLTLTALAPPLKAASHSAAPSGYGPHALDGKGATAVDKSNAMPPIGGAQTVLQRRPTASVASVPAPSREQRPCRGCEGHESYTAGVVLVATGGQSDALMSPRETRWVAACLTRPNP